MTVTDDIEEDRRRALKLAYEMTPETQSCEEAVAELIRLIRKARAERDRLRTERNALAELLHPIDGLMMYEDEAIADFAARRDPCPNVITGPRKWLARIRAARANVPRSVIKPWEES